MAQGDAAGLHFSHHDWELACDNTRTCRAAGYQSEDRERTMSVLLVREAGAGQPVTGQLVLGSYEADPGVRSANLLIDENALGALTFDAATGVAPLDDTQVAALLAAVRRDSRIEVDAGERGRWQLSDRGVSAVLLKMDEFQGRLGTRGALVRRGESDESGVLPAVRKPVIRVPSLPPTRAEDAALTQERAFVDALRASVPEDDCMPLSDDDVGERLTIMRLDDATVLASTTCWMAAYNSGDGYWLVDAVAPYRARLVTISGTSFEDGVIHAVHKGRGLADCMSSSSWAWDGRDFVKAGEATTGMCRLVSAGGTWDLPVYVTDIQR